LQIVLCLVNTFYFNVAVSGYTQFSSYWSNKWTPHNNCFTKEKEREQGTIHLNTVQMLTATHSDWCLEAFHCSSAVSGWWTIECHSREYLYINKKLCHSLNVLIVRITHYFYNYKF